jgi:hypothetical protein
MASNIRFGDVVESTFVVSKEQLAKRNRGFSPISYQGSPTVYRAGDVVNIPYEDEEISTIEAIGKAWEAFASGITPN